MSTVALARSGLATGSGNAADGDAMADRILDAALEQLAEHGLRHFSVEDVARRVGINRITIYRRFAGRDELLREAIFREGRRLFATVDAAVAGVRSPEDRMVEAFAVALAAVRQHPVVRRLLASEPDTLGSLVLSHGGAVVALARTYAAGYLGDPVRAEIVVRLGLSFIAVPDSVVPLTTPDDARVFARTFLLPKRRR